MTQANNLLQTIHSPELDEIDLLDSEDRQYDYLDAGTDVVGKSGKRSARRKRATEQATKKKQYTEDSIRLYLQEIGRIRLLRADEEIELARKIADLLELERIREGLEMQLDRSPRDGEWAEAVSMALPAFRHRLHVGRRAKEKMVQSNLRLVVAIAKKYMNRG